MRLAGAALVTAAGLLAGLTAVDGLRSYLESLYFGKLLLSI